MVVCVLIHNYRTRERERERARVIHCTGICFRPKSSVLSSVLEYCRDRVGKLGVAREWL